MLIHAQPLMVRRRERCGNLRRIGEIERTQRAHVIDVEVGSRTRARSDVLEDGPVVDPVLPSRHDLARGRERPKRLAQASAQCGFDRERRVHQLPITSPLVARLSRLRQFLSTVGLRALFRRAHVVGLLPPSFFGAPLRVLFGAANRISFTAGPTGLPCRSLYPRLECRPGARGGRAEKCACATSSTVDVPPAPVDGLVRGVPVLAQCSELLRPATHAPPTYRRAQRPGLMRPA